MEASNVLKEYLELFTADCRQLKLLVAPNAVVDWFGRTIRGPAKIHDYLRFDIAVHYDHSCFDKAEECEPIEQRPSHWKTKSLPQGDVDFVLPLNKVTGLAALKNYADSDLDDDDLEMQPLPAGNQTPEHQSSNATANVVGELTPPSSTIKLENPNASESESDLDDGDGATAPKRLKRTLPKPFSYLRRLPTASTKTTHVSKRPPIITPFDMQMLGDDTSSDEELDADYQKKLASEYTPLKYIEATGMLRAKPQQLITTDTPPTPHSIREWDRPVRLRISYRRNLSDHQLQIALVIYEFCRASDAHDESVGGSTPSLGIRRRNLMAQFDEAALSEPSNAAITTSNDEHVDHTAVAVISATEIGSTALPLTDLDDDAIIPVVLRTPTKSVHTPPATPKRRQRLPYAISGMKRINPPTPSTSTPKRSAARTLRL